MLNPQLLRRLLIYANGDLNLPVPICAARIIFALAPSSAASERVFSLVNSMFGKEQLKSLADFIQGSLMLRYNKRVVG